jgi:hypothetical protein
MYEFPRLGEEEIIRYLGLVRSVGSVGLFTDDSCIDAVKGFLSRKSQRWLLVMDGWDDPSRVNLRSYIPDINRHILISSPTEISTFGVPVQLVGLDEGAARELLLQNTDTLNTRMSPTIK